MDVLVTVGLIAAVILSGIAVVRSDFRSELPWAALIGFGVLLIARLT